MSKKNSKNASASTTETASSEKLTALSGIPIPTRGGGHGHLSKHLSELKVGDALGAQSGELAEIPASQVGGWRVAAKRLGIKLTCPRSKTKEDHHNIWRTE